MKHPLDQIKFGIIPITTYRGCLVTKIIGGYECLGKKSLTADGVDLIINEAEKDLHKSLKPLPL
jgi:hypothetical protein